MAFDDYEPDEIICETSDLDKAINLLMDGLENAAAHGIDDYSEYGRAFEKLNEIVEDMAAAADFDKVVNTQDYADKIEKIKLPHAMNHIKKAVRLLRQNNQS